jgi:3-oxoacyl-[acyl-carrier-protein] synthase-3
MNTEMQSMAQYGIGIAGASHKLGSNIQSNEDLCLNLPDTTPEWIISKTGIKRRYHITENESASSLAIVTNGSGSGG